jgi:dihydrofolate synthase/folylpolyglutamate synthase
MGHARIETPDDIFEYMMRFVNVERGQKTPFKLDRMKELCAALDDPQDTIKTAHVAGSKGKGSVATMIASALEHSGLPTGLYTSPHVVSFKERITRAGKFLPDKTYVDAGRMLIDVAERYASGSFPGREPPTYFELMTALAFIAFRQSGFQWASIETGLGGRLDSTNVIRPNVVALTTIELEHVEYLGDTLEKIALEKAGIMKQGVPAFSSPQREPVRRVFCERAQEVGCELTFIDDIASVEILSIGSEGTSARIEFSGGPVAQPLTIRLPMVGAVYAWNAALAACAVASARPDTLPGDIGESFASVQLPARFELSRKDGVTIVYEGAHTPDSIRAALETFERVFGRTGILLFACAQDKRHDEIARLFGDAWDRIVITRPGTFKASEPDAVARSFEAAGHRPELVPDTDSAAAYAFRLAHDTARPLLVIGSFYLCAEAKRVLG